ncbi:MAG: hypothetical protein OK455_02480 [Thaumarchaeota archaeon]|nr:hypothetical protein [Nitrososphaerota archaeon]
MDRAQIELATGSSGYNDHAQQGRFGSASQGLSTLHHSCDFDSFIRSRVDSLQERVTLESTPMLNP